MKVALVLLARLLSTEAAPLHQAVAIHQPGEVTANPQYGRGQGPKKTGKPLMDAITHIRTEMCWQRPHLMQHPKCLKFLGIHCREESTGAGICRQFEKEVTNECLKDPSEKALSQESQKSLELQQLQCEIAEDLATGKHHSDAGADSDGDGVPNVDDAFPMDAHETKDFDDDGIGDNADPDTDNDGVPNEEDEEPFNALVGRKANRPPGNVPLPRLVGPSPGPAPAAAGGPDADGDGVPDDEDRFPQDPNESGDSDGDGIGDNSDAFPDDSTEWLDSDGDGVGDNKDAFPQDPNESLDSDGDGYGDKSDLYPQDHTEWADSDGDGVGDNADHYPYDPNCHTDPCVLTDGSLAPAAAFVPAPGPSPALQASLRGGVAPSRTGGNGLLMPGAAPWTLNKVERGLPEQGFNEHSHGIIADHDDGKTFNGDWGDEFHWRENSVEHIKRICEEFPDNDWCRHRKGNYAGWKWPFH